MYYRCYISGATEAYNVKYDYVVNYGSHAANFEAITIGYYANVTYAGFVDITGTTSGNIPYILPKDMYYLFAFKVNNGIVGATLFNPPQISYSSIRVSYR